MVDQRQVDLGDLADGLEFTRPKKRHGGHHHAARPQYREPAGDQIGIVRAAQQHSIPGNQAEVVGQGGGDAVGAGQKVCIGPDRSPAGLRLRG